jgi:hypothetical protein
MPRKTEETNAVYLETFPAQDGNKEPTSEQVAEKSNVANIEQSETKAVVDGVWMLDGRYALAETIEDANALYEACFGGLPSEALPGDRYPRPTDKVLHRRNGAPVYGRVE